MYSKKNEIKNNKSVFFVIKTFFISSLIFNNIMLQLKFDNNNLIKNLNCYFFGNIYNLKIPRKYICNSINPLDSNFYHYDENIINNIDLLIINSQKSKIYDIFLLMGIMPFLNNESIIYLKINSKESYKLFKNKLKITTISNKLVYINKNNYNFIINNFREIVTYKWENYPNKKFMNNIRYIINNYYNESFIDIFDDSLNYNYKNYINYSFSNYTFDDLNNLMSKYLYLLFNRKFMGI